MRHPKEKNLLLDFLNPDLRRFWGLPFGNKRVDTQLGGVTNIALLWAHQFCILPQAFVLEDQFVSSLAKKLEPCFDIGLVRIPIKPGTTHFDKLEELQREYRNVRCHYNQLNSENQLKLAAKFLDDHSMANIEKTRHTGHHIISTLGAQSDQPDSHWRPILQHYSARTISQLVQHSVLLLDSGFALTHGEYAVPFSAKIEAADIHRILHTGYGDTYLSEYGATAFHNILSQHSFSPAGSRKDGRYDYMKISALLATLGIRDHLLKFEPHELVSLRTGPSGWNKCRENLNLVATQQNDTTRLTMHIAEIVQSDPKLAASVFAASNGRQKASISQVTELVSQFNQEFENYEPNYRSARMNTTKRHGKTPLVLLFAALQEEESVVIDALGLRADRESGTHVGMSNGYKLILISPRRMGRVPAALETYRFLRSMNTAAIESLASIAVLGIAGGFRKNEVKRGDVLSPRHVYDISNSKKEGAIDGRTAVEVFRSTPYKVNEGALKFLKDTTRFDVDQWALKAKKLSRRDDAAISIHMDKPMCCCDSVVKDEEWIDLVLDKVNPQLTGVDMESSGVCAAVETFGMNVDVSVLRGVSDLANPYKADDHWRKTAMYTACSLLSEILQAQAI